MNILIVAATSYEIAPLIKHLIDHAKKISFFEFELNGNHIFPLVTGVGSMLTSFGISRFNNIEKIDLAINLGLAGAFDQNLSLGDVVQVTKDRFADLGVEEKDGSFTDAYELELMNPDKFPFLDGWITNEVNDNFSHKAVTGLTVNRVHGAQNSINLITEKYFAEVESMEGAAFHYTCRVLDVEHVQIRSISNHVTPRDKDSWKIDLAIHNLNSSIVDYLGNMSEYQS